MRRLSGLLAVIVLGVFLTGCASQGEVSQQDAANFSKTPDGKNDGVANVNNDR